MPFKFSKVLRTKKKLFPVIFPVNILSCLQDKISGRNQKDHVLAFDPVDRSMSVVLMSEHAIRYEPLKSTRKPGNGNWSFRYDSTGRGQ